MEKAVVVLTLFVVLPMIAADKPLVLPKSRLVPAKSITGDVQDLTCPDGGTCDDTDTCCLLSSNSFGCCPDQGGNCCSDYSSCCQSGYVCDDLNQQCLKTGISEDVLKEILEKLPFLKK